jgi:hypothetical protein
MNEKSNSDCGLLFSFLPFEKGLVMSTFTKRDAHNFYIFFFKSSSIVKAKNEKRPWILRAREASVQIEGGTDLDTDQIWPSILIYISCGWDSFKEVCFSVYIFVSYIIIYKGQELYTGGIKNWSLRPCIEFVL